MREPLPFGRYLLLDRVALGGTAEVFAARVTEGEGKGDLRALKRLLPHLAEDPAQVDRFLAEGRLGQLLASPLLAAVHEAGRLGPTPYLALEWVPGRDLGAVRDALAAPAGAAMPAAQAALCGTRLFGALAVLHGARGAEGAPPGLVHRDVAPGNVMLSFAGEVKLLDLGLAAAGRGPPGRSAYRAPEVAAGPGAGTTPASDVYAAAAVLAEVAGAAAEPGTGFGRLLALARSPDPAARPSARDLAGALLPLAAGEPELSAWLGGLFPEAARRERERLLGTGWRGP